MVVPSHYNTGRDSLYKMLVRSPAKWTAETPTLYRLTVDLIENGQVTHSRSHAVGFREVSVRGGVLRVNGQPISFAASAATMSTPTWESPPGASIGFRTSA